MVDLYRIIKRINENEVKMTKMAKCGKRKTILAIELKDILSKIEYTKRRRKKHEKKTY